MDIVEKGTLKPEVPGRRKKRKTTDYVYGSERTWTG